jgi:membrane protease YdiL (CAAX protease family)
MKTLVRSSGLIGLATVAAYAIVLVGQTLWGVLAMVNVKFTPAIPWSAAVMPFVLVALVAFLAGRIGPKGESRRAMVPLAPVSAGAWGWSLAAGGAAVIAAAALWTVMATLVRVPPNVLTDLKGVPMTTVIPILLVSIAAAPLSEEIAFRGYAMSLLRRRFSPTAALVITSVIFAAAHLTQGLYAPKLIVYLLAGLAFGYVALRTGSLLPAMVVHSFADFVFFTTVWSHDAGRRLISEGGADGWFFANLALLAVFTPLALLGFRQLVRATGGERLVPSPAISAPGVGATEFG